MTDTEVLSAGGEAVHGQTGGQELSGGGGVEVEGSHPSQVLPEETGQLLPVLVGVQGLAESLAEGDGEFCLMAGHATC